MPWHPPCALSNLIVTNLSSCQRIDFSIFDCFFLLRPTAKLFAFLRSCVLLNTFATGFFTRCFSIWLCSFQSTISAITLRALASGADFSNPLRLQVRFRSPFIQFSLSFRSSIPENDTGSRRRTVFSTKLCLDFLFVLLFRAPTQFPVYRPGMNESVSFFVLSLERR